MQVIVKFQGYFNVMSTRKYFEKKKKNVFIAFKKWVMRTSNCNGFKVIRNILVKVKAIKSLF